MLGSVCLFEHPGPDSDIRHEVTPVDEPFLLLLREGVQAGADSGEEVSPVPERARLRESGEDESRYICSCSHMR